MFRRNQTRISEIILLAFPNLSSVKSLVVALLVVIYYVTLCGNLLIIILVTRSKKLQTPMYFFLTQLSTSDILLSTDVVPNTIVAMINDGLLISFNGCITQFCIFGASETFQCFILSVMSYDRYLAVCNPLRYSSIMNYSFLLSLILLSWLLGFSFTLVTTIMLSMLDFCGPNIIDHFFCDMAPIMKLSCSDTSMIHLEAMLASVFVMILPLMITVSSYGCIIQAILKISSNISRWKSFSTCSSHLIVVCIFYGTLIGIYMLPSEGLSSTVTKLISLLYTVGTPMLNPIIYSLRNKDIKEAIRLTTAV
ncbi:olfactory receptor 10A7-like [Hyperolius riggenbachi]|uniref:olfactory receptor 10A7-like n=1 Tax=Hyperolius riggenbachi TaxID=752182 RepID=UPI0035A26CC5